MKEEMKMKRILLSLSLILVLALGSVAVFADDAKPAAPFKSNIEILAEVIGEDAENVLEALRAGKSLSVQAQEADKFDEFVDAIKENRALRIDALVESGRLTKERAEVMKTFMENHDCTGTQQFAMRNALNNGERFGLGIGRGNGGQGLGPAAGLNGNGDGAVPGQGFGPGNGGRGGMMRGGFGQGGQGFGGVCFQGTTDAQ